MTIILTQTVTMTFEDEYNNSETFVNLHGLLHELLTEYKNRQEVDRKVTIMDCEVANCSPPRMQELLGKFDIQDGQCSIVT